MENVYLDHSATTPLREEVRRAMEPYHSELFGNPSSIHMPGQDARRAVEQARATIAAVLGAQPHEIIFTSGGTESNNIALQGAIRATTKKNPHIIVSSIEHPSVLECAKYLEKTDVGVTYLPVDRHGRVDPDEVQRSIRPETILVSVMLANNEVGTVQPALEIAEIAHDHGITFHVDAVQGAGKLPLHIEKVGADMMSLSAHKVNGPRGVGVLHVKTGTQIAPLCYGGGHEQGLRPGTLNVPAIVGAAEAFRLAEQERETFCEEIGTLRDKLEQGLQSRLPSLTIHGDQKRRLPHITNIGFARVDAETLLLALDSQGIFVSMGSACSSSSAEPSHVLQAMGVSSTQARCSLRFSLGRFNTPEQIDYVLDVLPKVVESLRSS